MIHDTNYLKVMFYGNTLEIDEYERNPASRGGKKGCLVSRGDRSEENRHKSLKRTYQNIRRLCEANFDQKCKFITFTFDSQFNDVTDIKVCNIAFKNFMKRLNDWCQKHTDWTDNIQYLAVVQFQDQNGRGAVHYHMLANMPFIDQQTLLGIWQNGSVNIQAVKDETSVTKKILSYITKEINDPRLAGQRRYLASKNLQKPITLVGEDAYSLIQQINLELKQIKSSWSIDHDFLGHIKHTEYSIDSSWRFIDILALPLIV